MFFQRKRPFVVVQRDCVKSFSSAILNVTHTELSDNFWSFLIFFSGHQWAEGQSTCILFQYTFQNMRKVFAFCRLLCFCYLIAGSHTFCHLTFNIVNLQLSQKLLYRFYRNSYKSYSSCSKLLNLLYQVFDALCIDQ